MEAPLRTLGMLPSFGNIISKASRPNILLSVLPYNYVIASLTMNKNSYKFFELIQLVKTLRLIPSFGAT